ncbi:MAG: hypothetical protein UY14_C0039G0004 [Parcubacteria group bacterium GW2011_GWA1_47_9]|nr:MAG: hypothetical protein UY14_C0039G0004 [Parcubacteria group bacterium GW2011_GWA1_47_9]
MKRSQKEVLSLALIFSLVLAQGNLPELNKRLLEFVNGAIKVLVALTVLVFIFGVIRYIAAGGDPEATKKARGFILWSVIGFALILGIWGVARFFLVGIFGGDATTIPTVPSIR